jgi:hypothetical protein
MAEDVLEMLRANVNMVGGAYAKKSIDWQKVCERTGKGSFTADDLEFAGIDYCLTLLPPPVKALRSCIEVAEIGTGFWLVKRKVFEMLIQKHPEYNYADDYYSTRGRATNHLFCDGIRNNRLLSEDYRFCFDWREIGGKVWLYPKAKLNHIGQYNFRGDFSRKLKVKKQPNEGAAI